MTLNPAYGRDYKSKKEVLDDWEANKDFVVADYGPDCGRYINKEDATHHKVGSVYIRYKQQRSIMKVST